MWNGTPKFQILTIEHQGSIRMEFIAVAAHARDFDASIAGIQYRQVEPILRRRHARLALSDINFGRYDLHGCKAIVRYGNGLHQLYRPSLRQHMQPAVYASHVDVVVV